jgi:hypothetical protein
MKATLWIGSAAMLAMLAAGCQSQRDRIAEDQAENREDAADEQPTTAVSEQEQPGTDQPADLNPMQAAARIDEVRLGRLAGGDNMVPEDAEVDDFAPGDPVVVSMDVSGTPPQSAVKVVWMGPGDSRLGEETQTVEAGTMALMFRAPDTSAWKVDDEYRAEVWLADEKIADVDFDVVAAADADK